LTTRILMIGDDRESTGLLGKSLNKYGFEVIAANTNWEGLHLVREQEPEAVLLDLMMLEMGGWQILKEIHLVSQAPIIIFSAFSEPDTITSVFEASSDYFLVKPIPVNTLVAHIKNTVVAAQQY